MNRSERHPLTRRVRIVLTAVAVAVSAIATTLVATPAVATPPSLGPFADEHVTGDTATLTSDWAKGPFRVVLVAPGIAVYQGRIDNVYNQLPDGQDPSNPRFLARVRVLIDQLRRSEAGDALLQDLGRAIPLPNPGENAWGDRVFYEDSRPSHINVVIGISMRPAQVAFGTSAPSGARNGLGSTSFVGLGADFPVHTEWNDLYDYVSVPQTTAAHELVHAWRALAGATDNLRWLQEVRRYDPLDRELTDTSRVNAEELRVVGNPNTEVRELDGTDTTLGPDTSLADSLAAADNVIAQYAGDRASLQLLQRARGLRETTADQIPTQWNISEQLGLMQRTHYSRRGLSAQRYVVPGSSDPNASPEADALAWGHNLESIDVDAQSDPVQYPSLFRPVTLGQLDQCTNNSVSMEICEQEPRPDGHETLTIVSDASGSCLTASNGTAPRDNVATIFGCGQSEHQTFTYHPETKTLAAGDATPTDFGATPSGVCLTADLTNLSSQTTLIPCNLKNPGQRWEYTKARQWVALNRDGTPFGCLNVVGDRRADGSALALWTCDTALNTTWTLTNRPPALPAWAVAPVGIASAEKVQLRSQLAGDKCLASNNGLQPQANTAVIRKCVTSGSEPTQMFTYHPDTSLLSLGDPGDTDYGAAPASPAVCLTATNGLGSSASYVSLQSCSTANARQRWQYTNTGLWEAVDRVGSPYGCLNIAGASTSENASTILWSCEHDAQSTWNVVVGHLNLSKYKIVNPNTGGAMTLKAKDAVRVGDQSGTTAAEATWSSGWMNGNGLRNIHQTGSDKCLALDASNTVTTDNYICNNAYWRFYQWPNGLYLLETGPVNLVIQRNVYACLRTPSGTSGDPSWEECDSTVWNNTANKYDWRIVPVWAARDRADTPPILRTFP